MLGTGQKLGTSPLSGGFLTTCLLGEVRTAPPPWTGIGQKSIRCAGMAGIGQPLGQAWDRASIRQAYDILPIRRASVRQPIGQAWNRLHIGWAEDRLPVAVGQAWDRPTLSKTLHCGQKVDKVET